MSIDYTPFDWYWIVAGDTSRVFSSAARAYVLVSNSNYQAWLAEGNLPTRIDTEANLLDVLAEQAVDCLPATTAGNTARQDRLIKVLRNSEIGKVLMQILLDHENRIRTLEKKLPVTMEQALSAVREKL